MENLQQYSVALLRESVIEHPKCCADVKIFEQSIVLIHATPDFFERSNEDLVAYFNEQIPVLTYQNAMGEEVVNQVVKVIKYYQLLDKLEFSDFTEVYSCFIEGTMADTADTIMGRYY